MTPEQFDVWAYGRFKAYLKDLAPTRLEQPGIDRVKAFLAGVESDRKVLVKQ